MYNLDSDACAYLLMGISLAIIITTMAMGILPDALKMWGVP